MPSRTYGQYCGFARALELVGERWALMVVRDLFVGPKRFSDLQRGLPKIPSNVLSSRLKELEEAGLVQRRLQGRPEGGVVYELTPDGRELEDAVVALSRWGAKRLGLPREDEIVTEDSMAMALRTTFRPSEAPKDDTRYLLILGEIEINAHVHDGTVTVGRGRLAEPDLIIETTHGLRALLAREITPAQARKRKLVSVTGDSALLGRFVQSFRI